MKSMEDSGRESKRAIILDGSKENDEEAQMAAGALHAELERSDIQFTHHILRDSKISHCTGCLRCWTKTPGDCAAVDDQREICDDLVRADLIVLITPVTFGGYSSDLKKGMDRMIPVLLPFFRKYNGETHHPSRYGNEWNLLGVGTMPVQDAEKEGLFKDIVNRNSLNMHSKSTTSIILLKGWSKEEIDRTVAAGLRRVTS
jgi:multimeric flavodoxin WrbA